MAIFRVLGKPVCKLTRAACSACGVGFADVCSKLRGRQDGQDPPSEAEALLDVDNDPSASSPIVKDDPEMPEEPELGFIPKCPKRFLDLRVAHQFPPPEVPLKSVLMLEETVQ